MRRWRVCGYDLLACKRALRVHRVRGARCRALRRARRACRRRPACRRAPGRPRVRASTSPQDSSSCRSSRTAPHAGSTSVASSAVSVMNSSLTTTNGVARSAASTSARSGKRRTGLAPRIASTPSLPARAASKHRRAYRGRRPRQHPHRFGSARIRLFAERIGDNRRARIRELAANAASSAA